MAFIIHSPPILVVFVYVCHTYKQVSRDFKSTIMFENDSNDLLLHKIMNSKNYSHEYIKEMHDELDKRRIKDASNELLIYEFMFPEKYSEQNLKNVEFELNSRGTETKKFNDFTYIDCVVSDFPSGWNTTLKEMFLNLRDNGWNRENKLNYNFSFDSITIEGLINKTNTILNEIVEQYIKRLHNTCCNCSSQKKVEFFEDEYLCQNCILEIINKRKITEISETGFKFYNFPTYSNETGKYDFLKWDDIKQIEIMIIPNRKDDICIELNKLTKKEEDKINENFMQNAIVNHFSFSSNFNINFFELLKKIPQKKISEQQSREIESILNNFKKCIICEKEAVLNDNCLLCNTSLLMLKNPSNLALKRYGNNEHRILNIRKEFLEMKKEDFYLRYIYENDKSFK